MVEKKGESFSERSRLVPRTGHFSNSFYSNVDELLALRDSLEEEGLIAKLVALPGSAEKAPNATIPYRP